MDCATWPKAIIVDAYLVCLQYSPPHGQDSNGIYTECHQPGLSKIPQGFPWTAALTYHAQTSTPYQTALLCRKLSHSRTNTAHWIRPRHPPSPLDGVWSLTARCDTQLSNQADSISPTLWLLLAAIISEKSLMPKKTSSEARGSRNAYARTIIT